MRVTLTIAAVLFGFGTALGSRARARISKFASSLVKEIDTGKQQFKVHFPKIEQRSCDAILFSVGTAASVGGYGSMAEALVEKGFIVAIVDPEKGSLTKLGEKKLHDAYAFAKIHLSSWTNGTCRSISKWLVGGHSAGGGTAHKVLVSDPSIADGIFSVDPFTKGDMGGKTDLPSLYWGFDVTTCFVTKSEAAEGYYGLSNKNKRIFIRAHKKMVWSKCGYSPQYFHCSVVDGGCTACTNCMDTPEHFFDDIANSVFAFSNALSKSLWSMDDMGLETVTPADLFVGTDV